MGLRFLVAYGRGRLFCRCVRVCLFVVLVWRIETESALGFCRDEVRIFFEGLGLFFPKGGRSGLLVGFR